MASPPEIVDLGFMPYADAYDIQRRTLTDILARRESASPSPGVILFVEHPAVITISRRPEARRHLLATPELLTRHGIETVETDRGGDITYHGPGQVVVYPILDLQRLRLRVGDYLRLLEQAVIDTCLDFNLPTVRDPAATGVWTRGPQDQPHAKIAAIGIRIRRWIAMHGLALNVTTNLAHFNLIVPCGLAGRPVTSLERELGPACPSMARVKERLGEHLARVVERRSTQSLA